MTDGLVTAKQLAELLNVSLTSVYKFTKSGDIPHVKVGSRGLRYNPQVVIDHLEIKSVKHD